MQKNTIGNSQIKEATRLNVKVPKKYEEHKIQKEIVKVIRLFYRTSLLFAVPSGGYRRLSEAQRLKAEGVLPGVSDLVFIHKGKIIFIEVKTPQGKQSPSQREFQRLVEAMGFPYWLMHSAAETLERIEKLDYSGC